MSNRLRAIRLLMLVVVVLTLVASQAGAKSYYFTSVDIEATILSNGDLHIREDRTASFSGSFSELWYQISLAGSDGLVDLSVYDSGRQLTESGSQKTGTYRTERSGDTMTVYVYYSASNQQRTFTFDYTLRNVVTAHKDTAELYWKFIGTGWDVESRSVRVEVFYPKGTDLDDVRVWAHGPLQGEVRLSESGSMLLTTEYLLPNTFVEGRTTFPLSAVPSATRQSGRNALESIVAEETRWAEHANEIREQVRDKLDRGEHVDIGIVQRQIQLRGEPLWKQWLVDYSLYIGLMLLALAVATYLYIHFQYGREYRPEFDGDYYRELPAEYSPAVLGVLWRFGSPGTEDFTAEIMNLARRGYLRIVERQTERKRALGLLGTKTEIDYYIEKTEKLKQGASLRQYERDLVDLVFSAGSDDSVSFDQIASYAKRNPTRFQSMFKGWKAAVSAFAEDFNFFDREIGKGKALGALAGFAILGVGIALTSIGSHYLAMSGGIIAIISGMVLVVMSLIISRRSRSGATEMRKWQAFRKFLTDFSSMDSATIPSLIIWEHYLVYAITLGVAKEVIKQLPLVFPELRDDPTRFGRNWLLVSTLGSSPVRAFDSLNQLTSAMNQSIAQAIAQSSQSSGSGSGGGFSVGGGGGGGGTGGGAR